MACRTAGPPPRRISSPSAGSYSIVAIYLFRDPTVETLLDIEGDAADLDRERLILRRGEEAFAIQVDLVELVLGALQVFAGFQDLGRQRSEEPTSELQSIMRITYAVFCL